MGKFEIRRWINIPHPKHQNYASIKLWLGPREDTVKFSYSDKWWVEVDVLTAALDELDRFEGRRKRLKAEDIEITIGVEHEEDYFSHRGDVTSLTLTPGESGVGCVRIRAIGGINYSMLGGNRDSEVKREDLRHAIKHRSNLKDAS